jgi:hypothetical protein
MLGRPVADQQSWTGMLSPPQKHFLVSRERVGEFVGRKSQLRDILSYFTATSTTEPRCLILHALGGQGKSQIALEYCRRSREVYRGIFWINANSEVMAIQSYERIAAALMGPPSPVIDSADNMIELVKRRLESWSERWLLVFDNYDNPDEFPGVKRFIPTSS